MSLPRNTVIDNRYTVKELIGEGGMAEVYRVRHQTLGTAYALKVLKVDSAQVRKRLIREGQLQAQLRHPNVVNVSDTVMVDGDPGLVMEFVEGRSLDEVLKKERLSLEQVDHIARGVIAGVQAAHLMGFVHRDLKPANIMLAKNGSSIIPKVTDFGLAKPAEGGHTLTKSGMMMGTPAYMAPEQIMDAKKVDHRADIFSLGAILFHMTTGRKPFNYESIAETLTAVLDGRRPNLRDLAPDLPAHKIAAIDGALMTDRDARTPDCDTLLAMWIGAPVVPEASPFKSDFGELIEHLPAAEEKTVKLIRPSSPVKRRSEAETVLYPKPTPPPPPDHTRTLAIVALSVVFILFVTLFGGVVSAAVMAVLLAPL